MGSALYAGGSLRAERTEALRYGLVFDTRFADRGVGGREDAGAKVDRKCALGPVSSDGSGAISGSIRYAYACYC